MDLTHTIVFSTEELGGEDLSSQEILLDCFKVLL